MNRHLAVELIASGQLALSQIADRLGIHKSTAWRIMTGRSHPELQELIREAQRGYRDRARRLGSKWIAQIVMKQIEVGLKNNGWVGLRARQDLLDRFLGPEDDGKSDDAPRPMLPMRSMTELSLPLRAAVLKELGGPELGPEDYAEAGVPYPGDPEDDAFEPVLWNKSETWKPVGAAAKKEKIAAAERANTAKSPGKQESRSASGRDPPDGSK